MELPIFPLNGAVLFPGTNLPLNIFENRYIDMVDYALARNREIGMIQSDDNNDLYKVGCVGKINSFNETNDGRYLISLQGTNCFKIIKEIKVDYSFRLVDTELIKKIEENKSVLKDENRKKILQKYKNINVIYCAGYGRPNLFMMNPEAVLEANIYNLIPYKFLNLQHDYLRYL